MEHGTFTGRILALVRRRPFHPFTVAMITGDRVVIDNPDALAVRDGRALFVAPGKVPVIIDHHEVSQLVGDLPGNT